MLRECEKDFPHLTVRLLLSIDRSAGEETARECVQLAKKFVIDEPAETGTAPYVVGVDFSGNPAGDGRFADFEGVLGEARELGLKLSVHCGEVKAMQAEENARVLAFKPERLGHCTYLSEEDLATVAASGIPVEICITSNFCTSGHYVVNQLIHVKSLWDKGARLSFCCDDTALFAT